MSIKVSSSISRRTVLIAVATGPALALKSAYAAKLPQTAAGYTDKGKEGTDCDDCKFWLPPNGCKTVSGVISPHGTCKLFAAKG